MDEQGSEPIAGGVMKPCPPEDHRDAWMTWTHQADGFNFFQCERCKWVKPDLSSKAIKQYGDQVAREDAEIVRQHYWNSLEYADVGKKHGEGIATAILKRRGLT